MAITDTTTPGSDGWWMLRLWQRLNGEQKRLELLERYRAGTPDLPWASEATASKFYKFQQTSRTNFASLIVQAPCERIGIRSISTAADTDVSGDARAWQMVLANDVDMQFAAAVYDAFTFGRGYLATYSPAPGDEFSIITAEDPRQFITEPDPMRRTVQRAAFKVLHDSTYGLDVAILWLPGKKVVAVQERTVTATPKRENGPLGASLPQQVSFSPSAFTIRGERPDDATDPYWSETYTSEKVPVQLIENRDGVGEFETHIDLLDRINHLTFMLMVTITMQAFRQRALKQSDKDTIEPLPDKDEETGRPINYDELFEAGPDAMWLLPQGAEIWESQQADVSGSITAIKNELLKLSAVTRTPMSMLTPDAIAQSAEGAQLAREGIVFKVEEFLRGAGRAVSRAIALGFEFMGDETRSDPATITTNFLPAERYSLAEKGSAASQATTSLPVETIQDVIWQLTPQEIETAKAQRMQDVMVQQVAASAGSAQSQSLTPAFRAPQLTAGSGDNAGS